MKELVIAFIASMAIAASTIVLTYVAINFLL